MFEVDWLSGWIRKGCPLVGGRVGGFVEIKDQPGMINNLLGFAMPLIGL